MKIFVFTLGNSRPFFTQLTIQQVPVVTQKYHDSPLLKMFKNSNNKQF
jgi:hypothetical protein